MCNYGICLKKNIYFLSYFLKKKKNVNVIVNGVKGFINDVKIGYFLLL